MLSLFGFGKRRRRSTKSRKSTKGGRGRKSPPPKQLLKIAKRLGLKVTVKCGSKRVYKSKSSIKKAVVKKLRMIKKKKLAHKKKLLKKKKSRKGSKFGRRTRRVRRSRFGMNKPSAEMMNMYFGRRY